MEQRSTWSLNPSHYELIDYFHLERAELQEWLQYCEVYYGPHRPLFNGMDSTVPYWLKRDTEFVGGVMMSPNRLHTLYLIPPMQDEVGMIRMLKTVLLECSDLSKPIYAHSIVLEQVDSFVRAGFRPEEYRCRMMKRPTQTLTFQIEEDKHFDVISPTCMIYQGYWEMERAHEIAHFLYKAYAGSYEVINMTRQSFQDYISWVSTFAPQSSENSQKASSLVYDGHSHALIGVCLITLVEGTPNVFALAVLPSYRQKGVGSLMLKRALTLLVPQYSQLQIYVTQGNRIESVAYNLGFMPGPLEVHRMMLP